MQVQATVEQYGTNPVVRARNLVTTLIARTELGLFGASRAVSRETFPEQCTIPNGDVQAFLKVRVEQFAIAGVSVPADVPMDTAILAIAEGVARLIETTDGVSEETAKRIAIEYVTAACFVRPVEVMEFTTYLAQALALRRVFKRINEAKTLSTHDAFETLDASEVKAISEDAAQAWGEIETIYQHAPFLRTLRRHVQSHPTYADAYAWELLRGMDETTRQATIAQIYAMVGERGTQSVTVATVVDAWNRVQGNLALSQGNEFGVSIETLLLATGHDHFAGMKPNGGTKVEIEQGSAEGFGQILAGLFGSVTGAIRRKSDQEIEITASITEGMGAAPSAVAIPVASRSGIAQQYAQ